MATTSHAEGAVPPVFDARRVVEAIGSTQERLRTAAVVKDALSREDAIEPEHGWPSTFPVSWLRERLTLSPTEERVLWVLIAHELCPVSRRWIRDLNTEQIADPTLDAIRRVVYGVAPTIDAWRELSAEGALRRRGLIARTDGAADAPEHRQTFRVASRVLALAHGDAGLDPELATFAAFDDSEVGLEQLEAAAEFVRSSPR